MKIPESVRIGGVEYRVLDKQPALNDGERLLYGQIDYCSNEIKLSDFEQGHEARCVTLWHEILHGVRKHANMDIQDEEKVVEMFARGIYQVLQDNGGRLFDLKETDEPAQRPAPTPEGGTDNVCNRL